MLATHLADTEKYVLRARWGCLLLYATQVQEVITVPDGVGKASKTEFEGVDWKEYEFLPVDAPKRRNLSRTQKLVPSLGRSHLARVRARQPCEIRKMEQRVAMHH